ncbi:hypothetical protein ACFQ8Q_00010 [Streptomyces cyaneofuscatus]|uniref:hypothetical protein n=1 Tax=Streptomyces cyaneofuscatus TaxID=66883 RepID=UPI00368E35AB
MLVNGQLLDACQPLCEGKPEGRAGSETGGLHDLCSSLGFDEDAVGAGDTEHVLGVVAGAVEDFRERDVIVQTVFDNVEQGQCRAVQTVSEDGVGDPEPVRARRR